MRGGQATPPLMQNQTQHTPTILEAADMAVPLLSFVARHPLATENLQGDDKIARLSNESKPI